MSQKPISPRNLSVPETYYPETYYPETYYLQKFYNHYRFTRDYHALSGLGPSAYTYSVKCNLSYFILFYHF